MAGEQRKAPRIRADLALVEQGLAPSREKARALILAGEVLAGDRPVDKAGDLVEAKAELRLRSAPMPYVSRGGLKLAHALDVFGVDPRGLIALDVGASTGGFTDCLLQRGAARVHCVGREHLFSAEVLLPFCDVAAVETVSARNKESSQQGSLKQTFHREISNFQKLNLG